MVREVRLSLSRSWVQVLNLPDERSIRETGIGYYSVYLVSLQAYHLFNVYVAGFAKLVSS